MGGKRRISNGRKRKSPGTHRSGEGLSGHLRPRPELYWFFYDPSGAVEVPLPWRGKDRLTRGVRPGIRPEAWRNDLFRDDEGNRRLRRRYADAGNLVGRQD